MPHSFRKCPTKGMATAEEPPSLPFYTVTPCLFKLPPFISTSFIHVRLYPVIPSYNWPSSPPRTLNFTHKLFTLLSFKITKKLTHSTTTPLHLHKIPATAFIHVFIALIFPSCHVKWFSQLSYFYSLHSWLLCPFLCPNLWSICRYLQENTIP